AFRTASIGRLVRSVIETFTTRYDGIMAGTYGGELTTDAGSQGRDFLLQLQEIARAHVFSTAPTLKLEIMGRRVICDLMDVFWEGAEHLPIDNPPSTKDFPGKIGALMSDNYRRVFQHFAKDSPLPT